MTDEPPVPSFTEDTRVLVPLSLPEPEPISPWLRSFLDSVRVHLLACYVVPDQTSPEQARDEFGDEADETLDAFVEDFREFSPDVDSSLVFTPDMVHTVERVAGELDVDAIVQPRQVGDIRAILAVVTRSIDYDRFVKSLSALVDADIERLKVLQVGSSDADRDERELMVDGICSRLADRGISEKIVESDVLATDEPTEEVSEIAEAFDVVVVAEREPTLTDRLAGTIAEEIFRTSEIPVVLVRLPQSK